jgi:type I restriction-modification system DNA methylase subunit
MQLSLDGTVVLPKDAYDFGTRTSGETHGVVLTKPHVVDLILDLAGYTPTRNLCTMKLLEPACGKGAFLVPAVERLLQVARKRRVDLVELRDCIAAFDIDEAHVIESRDAVTAVLKRNGASTKQAQDLTGRWISHGDFLLSPIGHTFDAIVGNPPTSVSSNWPQCFRLSTAADTFPSTTEPISTWPLSRRHYTF